MFVLAAVGVFTFAYWLSAAVGDIVFTAQEERRMAAPLRAALGLLLTTAYFAAAWQLASIAQSWAVGLALMAAYAWANRKRLALAGEVRAHVRGYFACLAAVVLFFAPIIASRAPGPFTEGGGDITIYADVTKLLTDGGMTAFGQPSPDFRNVVPNLRSLLDFRSGDRYVKYAAARADFIARNEDRLNPPVADAQAYRAVADVFFTSVYYAPYAPFAFLAGDTNYAVYYGVQAFFYAVLLLSVWYFFAPAGRPAAVAATTMAAGSHALVSAYYNGYSMQGLSMAVSALTLSVATIVRPASVAGLRCYGIGLALVWLCYTHFLSLVAPLLLIGLWAQFAAPRTAPASWREPIDATAAESIVRTVVGGFFVTLLAVMLASGSGKALDFVAGLLKTLIGGARSDYLGDRIAPLSTSWMAFLFGFVSQQHLPPFAQIHAWLLNGIRVGIAAGFVGLIVGAVLVARSWSKGARATVVIYGVLVLTVAAHLLFAQSSLYTQAKGAQDCLVLLYCALVLPLTLGKGDVDGTGRRQRWAGALIWVLAAFVGALLVVRAVDGSHLAWGLDRAVILGPSYFSEAHRIRGEDPQALVLFEPRKSADLYVSIQPFAGARMVPTRYLAMQRLVLRPTVSASRINASELLAASDIPHLWTLSAHRLGGDPDEWRAERLAAHPGVALLLFADDYERDFGRKARSTRAGDEGMFSYVRNGAAILYVPAGAAHEVEVTLMAREPSGQEPLVHELRRRIADREIAARLEEDAAHARLRQEIAAGTAPRLLTIARFGGEYWLNVRVDGKDIVSESRP